MSKVRLGVEAPREVPVHRREIHELLQRERAKLEAAKKRGNASIPDQPLIDTDTPEPAEPAGIPPRTPPVRKTVPESLDLPQLSPLGNWLYRVWRGRRQWFRSRPKEYWELPRLAKASSYGAPERAGYTKVVRRRLQTRDRSPLQNCWYGLLVYLTRRSRHRRKPSLGVQRRLQKKVDGLMGHIERLRRMYELRQAADEARVVELSEVVENITASVNQVRRAAQDISQLNLFGFPQLLREGIMSAVLLSPTPLSEAELLGSLLVLLQREVTLSSLRAQLTHLTGAKVLRSSSDKSGVKRFVKGDRFYTEYTHYLKRRFG